MQCCISNVSAIAIETAKRIERRDLPTIKHPGSNTPLLYSHLSKYRDRKAFLFYERRRYGRLSEFPSIKLNRSPWQHPFVAPSSIAWQQLNKQFPLVDSDTFRSWSLIKGGPSVHVLVWLCWIPQTADLKKDRVLGRASGLGHCGWGATYAKSIVKNESSLVRW